MSLFSQVLSLAFNLINLPFSLEGRSDNSVFPFDVLRNMSEPCTTILFQMGENELKFTALPRGLCSNCCPAKIQRDVRFMAYTKYNPTNGGYVYPFKPGAARRAGVDSRLSTVIFIHGFSEASPGQSGQTIMDAYLNRQEPYNIILLDWSELASFPWYATAAANVKHVARRLKIFLEVFHDSGELPIQNIHIVGFSLGCHIAGMAGKMLRNGLRIPRITGLDPALPEFSLKDTSRRLSETDANYVDVIHTDSGIFGFPISIGHADFYPNGGRALQPGCQPSYLVRRGIADQVLACSHVRAWRLYAESVRDEQAFPATKCKIWRGANKRCSFTIDAYMGYANKNFARGSHYLVTHESKPFGARSIQEKRGFLLSH